MSLVLWGGRRGDVQYGSIQWRRRNIPIGTPTIEVDSARYFDVWTLFVVVGDPVGERFRVVGIEGDRMGVERVAA